MKNLPKTRSALLKRLDHYSEFVRGSINSVCATCHRAHCICQKRRSRKAYRLTYKDSQQKTRIVYVPRRYLPAMRKMIANYAQVRKIIEQLMETNVEAFKKAARQ